MSFIEIVAGQRLRWGLVSKLGEGDAGEVYLVESLLDRKPAILKRPHRSAFSNEILRQAAQIKNEGSVLATLLAALRPAGVGAPALLDQSPGGAELGDRAFIVIEQAPGLDLSTLARWSRFPPDQEALDALPPADNHLARRVADAGYLPEPLLLNILCRLFDLFASLASRPVGVVWNDVKPDHLFWDAAQSHLTVIDWGNSQYLGGDGSSEDRRYSHNDDYRQFLAVMGRFLDEYNPKLTERLEWPQPEAVSVDLAPQYVALGERLHSLQAEAAASLRELQRQEADCLTIGTPERGDIEELSRLQLRLLDFGAAPVAQGTDALFNRFALHLAAEENLSEFRLAARQAAGLDANRAGHWQLLDQIAAIAADDHAPLKPVVAHVLTLALAGDWPSALWELLQTSLDESSPAWWESISNQVRALYLGLSPEAISPFVAITRLYYTLQALAQQPANNSQMQSAERLKALMQLFSEDVLKKWRQLEPPPPNSGLDYAAIDTLLDEVENIIPGARQNVERVLSQARTHLEIVLSAWRERDFSTARRGLRQVFMWDPDRLRLFQADRAMHLTSRWLLRLRNGPPGGEPFPDYLTGVELQGRDIRNQVAPAPWLDLILETLKQLRNGGKPADLLLSHPELLTDMPWLSEYRSRETISLPRQIPLTFDRSTQTARGTGVPGVSAGRLGQNMDLHLTIPLDTWLPEARGSSARVFNGRVQNYAADVAVKVMRPDSAEYALPLFREEAQILTILHDVPGVTPLLEMGFIQLPQGQSLPAEDRSAPAAGLYGEVQRFAPEQAQNFLTILERQASLGWLPYLILEKRRPENNLIMFCDAGHTRGWFLPLRESLFLSLQICDILQIAHDRSIVYRDHKILHYYWDPDEAGVITIDWNIARRHPQGLTRAERQFDIVQFGARALHHILTGRPAPGALPLGPNRPEEIEQSAHQYAVRWTYDDERLPNRLKEIIAGVLSEGYASIKELRADLLSIYTQMPATAND